LHGKLFRSLKGAVTLLEENYEQLRLNDIFFVLFLLNKYTKINDLIRKYDLNWNVREINLFKNDYVPWVND